MKLSSDILYEELAKTMRVVQLGNQCRTLSLDPPVFYTRGSSCENGGVYVTGIEDVPRIADEIQCLVIVVGGTVPPSSRPRRSCIFMLPDETNLIGVFGIVQSVFSRLSAWQEQLWDIMLSSSDYAAMIELSSRVLDRWMGIVDADLHLIVASTPMPEGHVASLLPSFSDRHEQNISHREPFTWSFDDKISVWCMNIFANGAYVGVLAIDTLGRPALDGELALFEYFANLVFRAFRNSVRKGKTRIVSRRNVLTDLLRGLPVSESQVSKVFSGKDLLSARWLCAVATPTDPDSRIPLQLFCEQFDSIKAVSCSFPYEDSEIVILVSTSDGTDADEAVRQITEKCAQTGLHAGLSREFQSIQRFQIHHRQALAALNLYDAAGASRPAISFEEVAFLYMKLNSMGEFDVGSIVPPELLALADRDAQDTDYWGTLKTYLDNDCNAMQTARDLFIHRSTLLYRLDRIKSRINLDDPESRLFIRYCMSLCELSKP